MKDKRRHKNEPNGMEISHPQTNSKMQNGKNEIYKHYNTEKSDEINKDSDLDEIDELCEEMNAFCNYVDDNFKKQKELDKYRDNQEYQLRDFDIDTREGILKIKKNYHYKIKKISKKYNKQKDYIRVHLFEKEEYMLNKNDNNNDYDGYYYDKLINLYHKRNNIIDETDYRFNIIKKKIITKKINEIEEYKKQREKERENLEQKQKKDYENYKTNYNLKIENKYKKYGNKMNEYEKASHNEERKEVKIKDPYPYHYY